MHLTRLIGWEAVVLGVLVAGALIAPVGAGALRPAGSPESGDVAPLKTQSEINVAGEAAAIDRLVAAKRAVTGMLPNPVLSEEQFLRRAWLDLGGRIPTLAEARAYLDDPAADRRSKLLDQLIASPAWSSRMFNWTADLLRVETRLQNRYPGQPWIDWLKDRLRSDARWDRLTTDLILSQGSASQPGNGGTGFWLRDAGMPLDHLANTIQVFLGTRIGCAQCHDHPFDRWTRLEFYRLAACTSGVQIPKGPPQSDGMRPAEMKKIVEALEPQQRQALRNLNEVVLTRVVEKGGGTIALPPDWQYSGNKAKEKIKFAPLYDIAGFDAKGGPREALAQWITSPDNPRFALTIANRQWKLLFGAGLIEPADDMKDETKAADPALMEHLCELMKKVQYDLRKFQRILVATEVWQRQASRREPEPGEAAGFAGPHLRRLSAEQLWDSLIALGIADPESVAGAKADGLYELFAEFNGASAEELIAAAKDLASAQSWKRERQVKLNQLRKQLNTAQAAKDKEASAALKAEIKAIDNEIAEGGPPAMQQLRKTDSRGAKNTPMRASEMQQPAPANHLLRTFGQSDRQLISNAMAAATTPQALALMNGKEIQALLTPTSALGKAVLAVTGDDRIRTLYLAILTRMPTPEELREANACLLADAKTGIADLAWALVNSTEFKFER